MNNKEITISIRLSTLITLCNQLRRVLPLDHDTDQWTADMVLWLEKIIEQNR